MMTVPVAKPGSSPPEMPKLSRASETWSAYIEAAVRARDGPGPEHAIKGAFAGKVCFTARYVNSKDLRK